MPDSIGVADEWKTDRATLATVTQAYAERRRALGDPTALIVVDAADRLKTVGLEQVRAFFDEGGIGLVLIGMPGLEKRLARYPQFYSRIGFVHEYRSLGIAELRQLLGRGWTPRASGSRAWRRWTKRPWRRSSASRAATSACSIAC